MSPSKTMWPAPWTLLLSHGVDLPYPEPRHPHLPEWAQQLPLVSLWSKQSLVSSLSPSGFKSEHSERSLVWGSGPLHKELGRMVEPDKERTLGPQSIPPGTCLRQLLLEGLPGPTFCHWFLLALLGYGLPCFQILTSSLLTDCI